MAPLALDTVVSPAEHTKQARELLRKALSRSEALSGVYRQLDSLMLEAKTRGLSWLEGLEYALGKMSDKHKVSVNIEQMRSLSLSLECTLPLWLQSTETKP